MQKPSSFHSMSTGLHKAAISNRLEHVGERITIGGDHEGQNRTGLHLLYITIIPSPFSSDARMTTDRYRGSL